MHRYTRTDTERCFKYNRFWGGHNHLVFIGRVLHIMLIKLQLSHAIKTQLRAPKVMSCLSLCPFAIRTPIVDNFRAWKASFFVA